MTDILITESPPKDETITDILITESPPKAAAITVTGKEEEKPNTEHTSKEVPLYKMTGSFEQKEKIVPPIVPVIYVTQVNPHESDSSDSDNVRLDVDKVKLISMYRELAAQVVADIATKASLFVSLRNSEKNKDDNVANKEISDRLPNPLRGLTNGADTDFYRQEIPPTEEIDGPGQQLWGQPVTADKIAVIELPQLRRKSMSGELMFGNVEENCAEKICQVDEIPDLGAKMEQCASLGDESSKAAEDGSDGIEVVDVENVSDKNDVYDSKKSNYVDYINDAEDVNELEKLTDDETVRDNKEMNVGNDVNDAKATMIANSGNNSDDGKNAANDGGNADDEGNTNEEENDNDGKNVTTNDDDNVGNDINNANDEAIVHHRSDVTEAENDGKVDEKSGEDEHDGEADKHDGEADEHDNEADEHDGEEMIEESLVSLHEQSMLEAAEIRSIQEECSDLQLLLFSSRSRDLRITAADQNKSVTNSALCLGQNPVHYRLV